MIVNVEGTSPTFTVQADAVTISNMRISCSAATPVLGSAGILVKSNGFHCMFKNMQIDQFYIGIDIWNGALWTIKDNHIMGNWWVGIRVNHLLDFDNVDGHIYNNWIYGPYTSAYGLAAIYWQSGNGLSVIGNKVNPCLLPGVSGGNYWYGMLIAPIQNGDPLPDGSGYSSNSSGGTGNGNYQTTVAIITYNSFENWIGGGIVAYCPNSGGPGSTIVSNNEFLAANSSATGAAGGTPGIGAMFTNRSGSGFLVGDVLTGGNLGGGSPTKYSFKVTQVTATGAVSEVLPQVFGAYTPSVSTAFPSFNNANPGVYGLDEPTGGHGGAAFFVLVAPVACITIFGNSNNYNYWVISDNYSYVPCNGIILSGASGVKLGGNMWQGSTNTTLGALAITPGVTTAGNMDQQIDMEPQMMFNGLTSKAILYRNSNDVPISNTAIAYFGNVRHLYTATINHVTSGTLGLFSFALPPYASVMCELTFEGALVGTNASFFVKMKRAVTNEANLSTVVLTVVDTDLYLIGGTTASTAVASNVTTVGTTNTFAIGVVPQAALDKLWIYIGTPAGSVTAITGRCTMKLDGIVSQVAYGNL